MMLPVDTKIFPNNDGVYVVGGALRDIQCGRTPFDYDLVVQQDPKRYADRLASNTSGHVVELGRPGHIMIRVITKNHVFDITPINGATIEEDLQRRDFTINAMALELSSGILIDPFGGRQDIDTRTIRMVDDDAFRNDSVRLIRAYRLMAMYEFAIEAQTAAAIRRDAYLIQEAAGERVREEFFKILQCTESYRTISQMPDTDILSAIFPELHQTQHNRPVYGLERDHVARALQAYQYLEVILNSEHHLLSAMTTLPPRDSDRKRIILLKCAMLLHDIGELLQTKIPGDDSYRIYDENKKSALLAKKICQRLRFSRYETDFVEFMIRNQSRLVFLFYAQQKKISVQRATVRFFLKCSNKTPYLLLFSLAKMNGSQVADRKVKSEFKAFIFKLLHHYLSDFRLRVTATPLLNGNDLIREFDLTPSPLFRRVLQRVQEEQMLNPKMTRKEAIKIVDELLKKL